MRFPRAGLTVLGLLIVFIATWGCGPHGDTGQSGAPDGFRPGGPEPGGGGGSPVRQIMRKLDDRPPNSLAKSIANGLKADPPAWETLRTQTAEYAQLAAELGKLDPPRGSKDSWSKLTADFAASATALDKAAQAKNLADARTAESKVGGSCKECHQTHRGGPGGGFGGPGGRGGPGGGRGGPGGGRPGGGPPGGA
jgi:translation initiation factor IF-2